MSAATSAVVVKRNGLSPLTKRIIWIVLIVALIVAMALSTRVVTKGSALAAGSGQFSAADYGKTQFPKMQEFISANAVGATELATAVAADQGAAAKKYGHSTDDVTYIIPVKFTGVVGQIPAAGYTPITVTGLAGDVKIGLQLGPAVNGTDLRDVTGKVTLNNFENQIQYQDAGQAINEQLKKDVLAKVDATGLQGKTISVEGAFTLINPKQWNVTPSKITVGP
ncbi:DUF2291 domain-containing protein [Microbacterium kribbense]|uniref:DUF2291 domain-containing protein n=1 Tax=Microbacterium kribbense TaxID=433645 RepID=A0ABP7GRX1_9MICO